MSNACRSASGSRSVAPPHRRDRRPAAGSADRAHGDRVAGRRRTSNAAAASRRINRRARRRSCAGSSRATAARCPPPAWCGSGASCSPRRPGMQGSFHGRGLRPAGRRRASGTSRAIITAATRRCWPSASATPGDPRGHRRAGRRSASCRCRRRSEADPWWRHLLSAGRRAPHVIARLPFGGRGNARPDGADALAIGRGAQQPTGRDRTLDRDRKRAEYQPRPPVLDPVGARSALHVHRAVASTRTAATR